MTYMFKDRKQTTAIILLALFLIRCGDADELTVLRAKISAVNQAIFSYEDSSKADQRAIDSLDMETEKQLGICKALADSANLFIDDHIMACAYIYEFDQEPIDILQEYVDAEDDDKIGTLLLKHVVLSLYGRDKKAYIDTVRKDLQALDSAKKRCIQRVEALQQQITTHRAQMQTDAEKIKALDEQKRRYIIQLRDQK